MAEKNGSWRPKFLRSLSSKPRRPSIDQAKRKQLISESLWPTTLDREAFKAAAILRSFCKDGAYHDTSNDASNNPAQDAKVKKVTKTIPPDVIRKAKGLAVFNILRAGLWENGAGGSGVVTMRLADGSWSSPAAIKVSTPEVGVVLGVDIFDCVLVLNNQQSVDAVKRGFCVVGNELYAVTGPLDVAWFMDSDDRARNAPVFSYFRSQQFYANVQAEDFAIKARDEENQAFYSPQKLTLPDILAGQVHSLPGTINGFMECVKIAQGEEGLDEGIVPQQPPPSDFSMVEDGQAFAIPDIEDPDQYGYAALEKYGIVVVDAATKSPVAAEEFEFNPSIKSPVFGKYHRKGDTSSMNGRSSWRQSSLSGMDRQEANSVRSRNSMQDSPDPTSPTIPSPTGVGHQIQMEDRDNEPTVKYKDDGSLYSSGTGVVPGPYRQSPEHVTSNRSSVKSIPKPTVIPEDPNERSLDASVMQSEPSAATREEASAHARNVSADDRTAPPTLPSLDRMEDFSISTEELPMRELEDARGSNAPSHKVDASTDTIRSADEEKNDEVDDESDTFEDMDEDFEIHDASASQPTPVIQGGAKAVSLSQAKVVNVSKPVPPSLPVRNPTRFMTPLTVTPPSAEEETTKTQEEEEGEALTQESDAQEVNGLTKDASGSQYDAAEVSPLSAFESQTEELYSRSRSVESPTHVENARPEIPNSLAGLRKGLGTPSPEDRSPERV